MSNYSENNEMSELEKEFELEMEEEPEEEELEYEFERALDFEEEPEERYESFEGVRNFAERFFELSQMSFESEAELDSELDKLIGEMEHDFFFKKIGRWLKKGVRGIGRLAKKAVRFGGKLLKRASPFKLFKGITSLLRGNLGGLLKSLAKTALGGLVPGGAAIMPALSALGFEVEESSPEEAREFWNKYVRLCEVAYEYMANNIDEDADDPMVASELAHDAYSYAMKRVFPGRKYPMLKRARPIAKGRRRRFAVRKGDIIEIRAI